MKNKNRSMIYRAYSLACFACLTLFSGLIHAEEKDIFMRFPTLMWQIGNNMEEGMDKTLIIDGIREYGRSGDPAFINGMKQILAEDRYLKFMNIDTGDFKIDGTYDKWINTGEKIEAQSKPAPVIPQYDITEFRYFMDRECNLYVMFKAKAKPLLPEEGNQSYIIWVTTESWPHIRLQFKNIPNAYAYKVYDARMPVDGSMGYGKWYSIEFEYKTGEIAEAKIPLGEILTLIGCPVPDTLWIQPEARYQSPGKEYFNPLEKIRIMTSYRNPALRMLMHQLSGGIVLRADENPLFNENYSFIMSVWSELAVDLLGNNMNEDAPIGQWYLNRQSNQQWKIVPIDSNGNNIIISRLTGKCLDVLEDKGMYYVVQKDFRNSGSQKWRLDYNTNGTVRIISDKYNMSMDIENGSRERYTKIILSPAGEAKSQQWKIQPAM